MSDILHELKRRCEAAGLNFEVDGEWDKEEAHQLGDTEPASLTIIFPVGDSGVLRTIEDGYTAEWLSKQPFESYGGIGGFAASWSHEQGIIECSLSRIMNYGILDSPDIEQVLQRPDQGEPTEQDVRAHQRIQFSSDVGLSVSIGSCSDMHWFLNGGGDPSSSGWTVKERAISLQIRDAEVTTHDDAKEILQRVADSVLFQLDYSRGLTLMLRRTPINDPYGDMFRLLRSLGSLKRPEAAPSLPSLRFAYDAQPMSLYWYAKSASSMPLVQFLAYYQVMEFYFPTYSRLDAQATLRNILKDPAFDPMRDSHIAKLLNVIKVSARGRAYGNETAQLEATIRHCVTAEEMQNFLISEDEDRYKFYTSNDAKKVVRERLPVREKADDYRGAVAKRVNAIRSRIVHTKGASGHQEPLFPFDPEVNYLDHDIELVEFLAQKVLIASSHPLRV